MTLLWLALVGAAADEPEPSDHTVIYYNARMALREGQPLEAVKLWLLRNALEEKTHSVSPYDADFQSVTWAALGDAGICQDGFPTDEAGAGLWPLALHNWVVRNMGRKGKVKRPRVFDAFQLGRQQRFVSLSDVLGSRELRTFHLFRGKCSRAKWVMINAGAPLNVDLSDRSVAAHLLQLLLQRSRTTLADDRVRGQASIEARLFDVYLQLTAMSAREAQQNAREAARKGRTIGMSRESVADMNQDAPAYDFSKYSEPARILQGSVKWPVSEWMSLSPDRRLFLFHHATAYGGDPATLQAIALGIVDELIERKQGEELGKWIARRVPPDDLAARELIWGGDRGQRLLGLDPTTGFRDRAVIAIHRGVHSLEEGDLPNALRSMAYALQYAPESVATESLQSLSRRWLTHVASQFTITDELLVTLKELVPRHDYAIILEDLMWRAAFHADRASFERGVANQPARTALSRRMALMGPLASGNIASFSAVIRDGLAKNPTETMLFLQEMVQRLELEDADVRMAHLPTLANVRRLVQPLTVETRGTGGRARIAVALMERTQALVEGVGDLGPDATARERARSLDPSSEVFAGSVRLAPADPLPWPFQDLDVPAPSIFTPLLLVPEEWRRPSGERILGWRIGG